MTVEFIRGDLFQSGADIIVIPTNMVGAMGKGVAKVAADTIPGLLDHYRSMLGRCTRHNFIVYHYNDTQYLMFPTKVHWRDKSPRDLVVYNLKRLRDILEKHRWPGRVALPAVGCGEGGLDWESDIGPLCQELFRDSYSHYEFYLLGQ